MNELHLHLALHAARNTDLTTPQIMRRIAIAAIDQQLSALVWGNLSERQLDGAVTYFMLEYCGAGE